MTKEEAVPLVADQLLKVPYGVALCTLSKERGDNPTVEETAAKFAEEAYNDVPNGTVEELKVRAIQFLQQNLDVQAEVNNYAI